MLVFGGLVRFSIYGWFTTSEVMIRRYIFKVNHQPGEPGLTNGYSCRFGFFHLSHRESAIPGFAIWQIPSTHLVDSVLFRIVVLCVNTPKISFIHSFIHSFIPSFIHLFVHCHYLCIRKIQKVCYTMVLILLWFEITIFRLLYFIDV